MDTFGAAHFYGSGDMFAERIPRQPRRPRHPRPTAEAISAWKQGQPDIQIYVKEGFSWEWRLSLRSSTALICQFIAALDAFGEELAVAFMFFQATQ